MADLVIVESPSKAKKIGPYLGSNYTVVASMGHFRDLPQKGMGFTVNGNDLEIDFELYPDSETLLNKIKGLAKKANTIYLATDPDREGEAIAWHLQEFLGKNLKYKRCTWTEITKSAILDAIKNPRTLDQNLVDAAITRRLLDREIGYPTSGLLRRKVSQTASGGRVQSVAVRLIVERNDEIDNFKPVKYFLLDAILKDEKSDKFLHTKLESYDNRRVCSHDDSVSYHIKSEKQAQDLVQEFKSGTWKIISMEEKEGAQKAPAPFTTGSLQQDAVRLLRMTIKDVTTAAQKLYEAGKITYIRTDGTTISEGAVVMVREFIEKNFPSQYLPSSPNVYKTKQKNAQEAHECIRPTHMDDKGDDIEDENQKRLYDLIWKRFLACQMTPVKKTLAKCQVKNGKGIFVAKGSIIRFDGWKKIYSDPEDDGDVDEQNSLLPSWVKADKKCDLEEIKSTSTQTNPPPRFTEASLVKEMERIGIGRPSTYASIINRIQTNGQTEIQKGKFISTDEGKKSVRILKNIFKEMWIEYQYSSQLENELDEISNGSKNWKSSFIREYSLFEKRMKDNIDEFSDVKLDLPIVEEKCNECGHGELYVKKGNFGKYKECVKCHSIQKQVYEKVGKDCPTCKTPLIYREMKKGDNAGAKYIACPTFGCYVEYPDNSEILDEKCPECTSKKMLLKNGKFGKYKECPECKHRPKSYVPAGEKCPKCNKDLAVRTISKGEKKGQTFKGCTGYPNCTYADFN